MIHNYKLCTKGIAQHFLHFFSVIKITQQSLSCKARIVREHLISYLTYISGIIHAVFTFNDKSHEN